MVFFIRMDFNLWNCQNSLHPQMWLIWLKFFENILHRIFIKFITFLKTTNVSKNNNISEKSLEKPCNKGFTRLSNRYCLCFPTNWTILLAISIATSSSGFLKILSEIYYVERNNDRIVFETLQMLMIVNFQKITFTLFKIFQYLYFYNIEDCLFH